MLFARLATVAYVVWGLLHLFAAYEVYTLGKTLEEGVIQGRILQDAWNILFFACFGTFVGVKYIWNNQRIGHWLNWVVVSAGDIGFILTMLVPGYISLVPGGLGPFFWLLAAGLSMLAMIDKRQEKHV